MGYFPFFVDLADKTGLVVGGGKVALRKIRNLLPYGPKIRVVAPEICTEIQALEGPELFYRAFLPEDLAGCTFAIAATDSRQVNHAVAQACRQQGILVNVIDDGQEGSFLFPSLVRQGSLNVGICTGGKYPMVSSFLKQRVEELVPENIEEILTYLSAQRAALKIRFPEKQKRDRALAALCRICMEQGGPLDPEQTEEILASAENGVLEL